MNITVLIVLIILLAGCGPITNNKKENTVSEIIENGFVEIAGNSYDLYQQSVVNYKYDGDNIIEKSDASKRYTYFYDNSLLTKEEIYSHDNLIMTIFFTYDEHGRVIKSENVIEKTKDTSYSIISYENNYKKITYYDSNGELSSVGEGELNDKNQIVQFTSKSKNGQTESVSHYKYKDDQVVFYKLSGKNGTLRERYSSYNNQGDPLSVISITFGDKNYLNASYYHYVYDQLKLVQETEYTVQVELDETQLNDFVKNIEYN